MARLSVLRAALAAMALYGAGFGFFVATMPKPFEGVPQVDGLAVFTGGSNRVATGMRIIVDGFEGPVLISGVHPDVTVGMLEGSAALPSSAADRVTLDTRAETTRQNVDSTMLWAGAHGLTAMDGKTIGIITSTYHVLRVRWLVFWRAAGLDVVYLPVQPNEASLKDLWREYNKVVLWWVLP